MFAIPCFVSFELCGFGNRSTKTSEVTKKQRQRSKFLLSLSDLNFIAELF